MLIIFALMSPNVELYQTVELPWGGHYRGLDEIKLFLAKIFPLIDSEVKISHYIHAGVQIVAIGKTSGFAKLTGKKFSCNLAHIWTVKEEKIVRFRDLYRHGCHEFCTGINLTVRLSLMTIKIRRKDVINSALA